MSTAPNGNDRIRTVCLEEAPLGKNSFSFPDNSIRTTRYTLLYFLPKFLFFQFTAFENIFFLFIAIIQQIPGVSPTSRFTTAIPLLFVIFFALLKEAYEDFKRFRHDQRENNRIVTVVHAGVKEVSVRCRDLLVGHLIKVRSGEAVPADSLLIGACSGDGSCFANTAMVNGEKMPKRFFAPPSLPLNGKLGGIVQVQNRIPEEDCDRGLEATLFLVTSPAPIELVRENFLLRGSVIEGRNDWVVALVTHTGVDCQIFSNTVQAKRKKTRVSGVMQLFFYLIFLFMILLSIGSAAAGLWYSNFQQQLPFLRAENFSQFLLGVLTFLVLYNNLLPVSLIVTAEVSKLQQVKFIDQDLEFYDEEIGCGAQVNASDVLDDLGQVSLLFTDKTGTLTSQQMTLSQTLSGTHRILAVDAALLETDELFLNLSAACTSVDVRCFGGSYSFHSSSQDDLAIVEGITKYHVVLKSSDQSIGGSLVIVQPNGSYLHWQVLDFLPFRSDRQRMTVAVEFNGVVYVVSKGSSSSLHLTAGMNALVSQIETWESKGLRSIVVACRMLSLAAWKRLPSADRLQKLENEEFRVIGAFALENRITEKTADTIMALKQAGIRVWMLTGDSLGSSLATASSAEMFSPHQPTKTISFSASSLSKEGAAYLQAQLNGIAEEKRAANFSQHVLCVDPLAVNEVLQEHSYQLLFSELALSATTVIFYRLTPKHKGDIVRLFQRVTKRVILAVGDGSNDVSMIQSANIGIGIRLGPSFITQATRYCDISLTQFGNLKKLLLVHGSWFYRRTVSVILFSLYKNNIFYISQFWFAFYNEFSGQTLFESWMVALFNIFFTLLPPFVIGIVDQHLGKDFLLSYPRLYRTGINGSLLNGTTFLRSIVISLVTSLGLFHSVHGICRGDIVISKYSGKIGGMWLVGCTLFAVIVLLIIYQAALTITSWSAVSIAIIGGNFLLFLPFMALYVWWFPPKGIGSELFGSLSPLFGAWYFWLTLLILPTIPCIVTVAWRYLKRQYNPSSYNIVQEIQQR